MHGHVPGWEERALGYKGDRPGNNEGPQRPGGETHRQEQVLTPTWALNPLPSL